MSEVNKIANYNQMMSWLTRPSTPQTETRQNFAEKGFAKATTAKKLKETVPNFLDEETFVKLRKEKKDLTNRQFADYLNNETDYIPDPRQAKEFGEISVERRFTAAKNKGLFPKTFTYKGSTASKAVTPKEIKEYKQYIKKNFPKKYDALLKLPEDKLKTKIFERRAYLNKIKKPGFLEDKNERNRKYRFEVSSGLRGKEAQKIYLEKAAEYKRSINKDANTFYRNVREGKTLLWEDLLKRTTLVKDPPFKLNKKIIKGKKYSKDETQKFVLTDKNGNKFKYDSLVEDLAKAGQDPQKVFRPYEQKAFLYKENLMKQIVENADKILGARDNPIHVHHVEGFSKNPFNVQLTFADQNLREGNARQTLTATFNNILKEEKAKTGGKTEGILNFNRKKKALNKFYDSLGPDIAAQLGKQEVGKRTSLVDMLKKKNIKMSKDQIKAATKLKASLLPGLEQIAQGIKNIPDDIAKKKYFTLGLKALGPIGTYIAVDDTYEALKAGRPVAEALEYGLIGTNLIGSAKDLMALSPEEREARSVVKQAEMADQIAQDESMLDTDFETPKVKSDLTLEEAEEKFEAAKARRKLERESQEADIAKARAISMSGLKDLITGKRFSGQEMPTQYMAAGGRIGFADGPDDPSRRKFMKIAGGIASIPLVGKFLKPAIVAAPKVAEVVKRSADGIPEFIGDLVTKVVTFGKKNFTGNRSDEFADQYRLDDYVVTQQGNKTTIQKFDDPDNPNYKEIEIELETDPETGGVTYKEASVRPDAEGKLKDVEEYVDDLDLEDMKKYTYDE